MHFAYGAITRYGPTFQTVRLCMNLVTPRDIPNRPHNPSTTEVVKVWALPLSLATTDGITSFSFPGVTEMFHFTPFRFIGL